MTFISLQLMLPILQGSVPPSVPSTAETYLPAACLILLLLLVASVVIFLVSSSRRTHREEERTALRLRERDELIARYEKEKDDLSRMYEGEKDELRGRISEISAQNAGLRASIDSQDRMIEDMRTAHAKEFEAQRQRHLSELSSLQTTITNLILTTGEELRKKNTASMGELLAPLQERFREFSDAVQGHRQQNIDSTSRLEQKIRDLEQMSISLGKEAKSLTEALLGQSKVQGNFGEMILTDILTASGLQEGVHFRTQAVMTDGNGKEILSGEGRKMIPDVQVFYPDGTVVVVDSKVSLNSYVSYMNASLPEERKAHAAAHVRSVQKHVKELSTKDYASYIDKGRRKVDYNIMFIPVEGAFQLALSEEPTLWTEAKESGVVIVSHMTLMIVLNLIQMSWRQHAQMQHIEKVYATAEGLLGALGKWMDSFEDVGKNLLKAQECYDDAHRRLTSSRGNVISRVEKLRLLSQGAVPLAGSGDQPSGELPGGGGEG